MCYSLELLKTKNLPEFLKTIRAKMLTIQVYLRDVGDFGTFMRLKKHHYEPRND